MCRTINNFMFFVVKSKAVAFKINKKLATSGSCYGKKFEKFKKILPSPKNAMKV